MKSIQKKPNSTWLKMNFSKSSHLWAIKTSIKISQKKWLAKILLGLLTNSPTWNKSDVILNGKPQVGIFPHKRQSLPGPCIRQSLVRPSLFFFYPREKPGWQIQLCTLDRLRGDLEGETEAAAGFLYPSSVLLQQVISSWEGRHLPQHSTAILQLPGLWG